MLFALTSPLSAQMGMPMPDLSGIWHPVVGSGGAYEMTGRDGKSQMEMAVVGTESVGGKTGYWMEMAMKEPRTGRDMYMKFLLAPADNNGMKAVRMVMQQAGQEPMEMDLSAGMGMGMGGGRTPQGTPSDIREKAERVGTETITVPAGTFTTEHYRMKDGSSDAWISDKVMPLGLVKSEGKGTSMVLTRVVTDAKSRITGTPTKFDPMQMMRERMGERMNERGR
jgi:hypothetical protein